VTLPDKRRYGIPQRKKLQVYLSPEDYDEVFRAAIKLEITISQYIAETAIRDARAVNEKFPTRSKVSLDLGRSLYRRPAMKDRKAAQSYISGDDWLEIRRAHHVLKVAGSNYIARLIVADARRVNSR
jgi:hypothetical protein